MEKKKCQSKEQRQNNFNKISKRIALFYEEDDYYAMKESIDDAAKRLIAIKVK